MAGFSWTLFQALGQALTTTPSSNIETLHLWLHESRQCQVVARLLLSPNNQLKDLTLQGPTLAGGGKEYSSIRTLPWNHSSLERLAVVATTVDVVGLTQGLASRPLRILDLSHSELRRDTEEPLFDGVGALATYLTSCSLSQLILHPCHGMDREDITTLVRAACEGTLQVLDLAGCAALELEDVVCVGELVATSCLCRVDLSPPPQHARQKYRPEMVELARLRIVEGFRTNKSLLSFVSQGLVFSDDIDFFGLRNQLLEDLQHTTLAGLLGRLDVVLTSHAQERRRNVPDRLHVGLLFHCLGQRMDLLPY